MNAILEKIIRDEIEEEKKIFNRECNLIVLDILDNPIRLLGLEKSEVLNKEFSILLNDLKNNHSLKIKKFTLFKIL